MPAEFPPPETPRSSFATPPAGRPAPVNGRAVESGRGAAWWSDGWRLFLAAPAAWIGVLVLYVLIVVGVSVVPLIGQIASGLLAPVLAAGVMVGFRDVDRHQSLRVSHLFSCFDDRLVPLLIAAAIYLACWIVLWTLAAILVFGVAGVGLALAMLYGDPSVLESAAFAGLGVGALVVLLLVTLISIPLMMAFWFVPALVALRRDQPVAAMQASFSGSLANVLPLLVYSLIGLVLAIAASIPLGLGWLVLGPVLGGSVYASYRDIFEPA